KPTKSLNEGFAATKNLQRYCTGSSGLNGRHEELKWHGRCRVKQQSHSHDARGNLLQKLHPFAAHCGIDCLEASDVAVRMCEARGEAAADRIGYTYEHDRDRRSLVHQGAGHGCGLSENGIRPQVNKLFCERLHSIRVTCGPAKFDAEVSAFR